MDDPFWNSYIPPLGWRCRCNVVRVPADEYEQSNSELAQSIGEAATDLPKQRIFRFNPGKTLKVFPPKHPYMPKGCGDCDKNLRLAYNPQSETCRACRAIAECKEKDTHLYKPVKDTDGLVMEHPEHGKTERDENIEFAKYFANKYGHKIYLLKRDDDTKCADAYNATLGCTQEYKICSSKTSIDNQLRKGYKQSPHVVIDLDFEKVTIKDAEDAIKDRVRRCKTVEDLTVKNGDKDAVYKKDELLNKDFKIRQEDFK